MSVIFPTYSEASVTSKYKIPVVSLLSDEEVDVAAQKLEASKTPKKICKSPTLSLKKSGERATSFDPVAHMYYNELMKHLTTNKHGFNEASTSKNKRVATAQSVPVVIIETSDDSSG